MMRSLWTASSGMSSQMLSVDTIANNIANVNTTGFKREKLEFQSLLYETMQGAGNLPEVVGNRPANLQVGHGVRAVASTRNFTMGHIELTASLTDFAIQGSGFMMVERGINGEIGFTRDGSFNLSPVGGGMLRLVTNDGFPVLDADGDWIEIEEAHAVNLAVSREGVFTSRDADGDVIELGINLGVFQFPNRQGLEAIGGNLFVQTAASGAAILEAPGDVGSMSQIIHQAIERSNVQIADEMVSLINSQRAFELNSRIIQTSDDMLQQATNMRR